MRPVSSTVSGSDRFGVFDSRRVRLVVGVISAAVLLFVLSMRGLAQFYTDFLWFDSLGRTDVWQRVLVAKILLVALFACAFFALLWVNLLIADRLAPKSRPPSPEEEMLIRYREAVAGRAWLVRSAVSAVFALMAVSGVSTQWEEWLLFINRQDFGTADPLFDTDIGFYVFRLPFLDFVIGWAFASFVIIFIVTSAFHFLNGGIRMPVAGISGGGGMGVGGAGTGKVVGSGGERVLPSVKVHLSAILAVLALLKAAGYWLARYELTASTRGVVDGALYTDVNAKRPALSLLLLISLFAAGLLLVNLRRRGWVLPVLAVGLWAFVALVMGNMYPSFVQRFRVDPNETAREAEYTADNIAATRAAYSLTPDVDVSRRTFDYDDDLEPDQIRAAGQTVRNARILDPFILTDTFDKEQGERDFYRFSPVLDVDRYEIDGDLTQVVLAARELNLSELGSWERQHVAITHGYGLAMALANVTNVRGSPEFVAGGLPVQVDPSVSLELDEPQIYVGEGLDGYALVGATTRDEVDYVDGNGKDVPFRYDGSGGVGIGSLLRRAAFALRFAQLDPLISNYIGSDTKVIYMRDVRERVANIAPFLEFDSDVYPVVHDGRIFHVIDAYTTTDRYPYSQQADVGGLPFDADLRTVGANYIRNSVKAVIDSYSGEVTLYVMPTSDPIIEAWRSAFPDLFTDFDDMPDGLREHLRFPHDLFTVQTNMWASYQVSEPEALIIGTELWAVAQDPGRSVTAGGLAEAVVDEESGLITRRERRVQAYYSLIQLPGEDEASFVVLRSFVPVSEDDSRKELTAFMVGETGSDGMSRLVSYEMSNLLAPGPAIVASNISTNPAISRELTLLNDQGSSVDFGDLLLLPVDDSMLYVRPLYVRAKGTQIPLLAGVIAAVGDRTALGETLGDALRKLYPGEDFTGVALQPVLVDGDRSAAGDGAAGDGAAGDGAAGNDGAAGGVWSGAGDDGLVGDVGGMDTGVTGSVGGASDDPEALSARLEELRMRDPEAADEVAELIAWLLDLLSEQS